jgi:hypothetical protein
MDGFKPLELLQCESTQWQRSEPKVRVRPHSQLQYKQPIIRPGDYDLECEKGVSDLGPAAEKGENTGGLV